MSRDRPRTVEILVVAPNFKRRLSGVTSTIAQLVPLQSRTDGVFALGPGLPPSVPRIRFRDLLGFWRRPQTRPFRIWHARRNVEMLAGIALRDILRMPVRLVFTSAAQRHHRRWTRSLIGRMDHVIATSGRSAAFLERPATVILHGIDLQRFASDGPADPAATFAGQFVVGCSGRIRPSKGTDLFVEAMIELLPGRPGWIAVATGRATAENAEFLLSLKRRVAEAGLEQRILFPGEVADVAPWFRRFDLYVAPPRVEGFGLTPLEAMAAGTPVVVTDAGAFREMIREGETGTVVPVDDSGALARACAPYMDNALLREKHGAAALAHVREHFPLQREVQEIGAVYREMWRADPSLRIR